MENIGYNNLLSIAIAISVILICCIISHLFEKYFFSKYKNKVKNIINTDNKPKS